MLDETAVGSSGRRLRRGADRPRRPRLRVRAARLERHGRPSAGAHRPLRAPGRRRRAPCASRASTGWRSRCAAAATTSPATRCATAGVVVDLSAQRAVEVDPDRADGARGPRRAARRRRSRDAGLRARHADRQRLAHRRGRSDARRRARAGSPASTGPRATTCSRAEVVTADGERVTASAEENPDLLWGLRGGGGNFGIVTALEYRLHPVGPQVIAGGVVHDFADAPEVLRFFADFAAAAPDELSVTASTFRAPPGFPVAPELHGELRDGPGRLLRRRPRRGRAGPTPAAQLRAPAGGSRRADALHGPAERLGCGVPEWSAQLLEVALRRGDQRRGHREGHRARAAHDLAAVVLLLPAPRWRHRTRRARHRRLQPPRRGVRVHDPDRVGGPRRGRRAHRVGARALLGHGAPTPTASTSTTSGSRAPSA